MSAALGPEVGLWGARDEVFGRLAGVWHFRRHIIPYATVSGIAALTSSRDGRLFYCEQGRLHLADGQILKATRRYLFEESSAGFTVLFAEDSPRVFHRIALDEENQIWAGEALHICGADHYQSRYEFLTDGSFVVRHVVRGPAKDYLMTTHYTRSENC
jgi:hypothetical protein